MIKIFNIFTLKPGKKQEGLPYLREHLELCQAFGLTDGYLGQSINNPDQYIVTGIFDDQESWEKLSHKLELCEIEGDCFIDIMPLLEKPPKYYSFQLIEEQ